MRAVHGSLHNVLRRTIWSARRSLKAPPTTRQEGTRTGTKEAGRNGRVPSTLSSPRVTGCADWIEGVIGTGRKPTAVDNRML